MIKLLNDEIYQNKLNIEDKGKYTLKNHCNTRVVKLSFESNPSISIEDIFISIDDNFSKNIKISLNSLNTVIKQNLQKFSKIKLPILINTDNNTLLISTIYLNLLDMKLRQLFKRKETFISQRFESIFEEISNLDIEENMQSFLGSLENRNSKVVTFLDYLYNENKK